MCAREREGEGGNHSSAPTSILIADSFQSRKAAEERPAAELSKLHTQRTLCREPGSLVGSDGERGGRGAGEVEAGWGPSRRRGQCHAAGN